MSSTQSIRFRRPLSQKKPEEIQKKPQRHTGILQDQLRRNAPPPWSPSFSVALRIVVFVRALTAMYSNIDDCDEVFNFWEPLHFFQHAYGFQTWETSPEYAIRSWAYILLHFPVSQLTTRISGPNQKRAAFFAVRMALAALSSFAEVTLYRSVYTMVNERVGRYLFFMLTSSAGMWNASAAFLPSSFAMYTTMFAFAASVAPASLQRNRKTLVATLMFATGAIVGWPFALALAIPFVLEELFFISGDRVPPSSRNSWFIARCGRLIHSGALASLIFIPIIAIDSVAYGRLTIVPWNIVRYNVFSDRGPNLYGTEPWNYYILNLLLNFNVLVPFAFFSLPALGVTYLVDRKRLGLTRPSAEESSPFTILALKLAPFYLWLLILTLQEHKEERFMFPAYGLLCFNAAVTIYLARGWMEVAFISITKSPYRGSKSSLFSSFTSSVVLFSMLLSASRIFANWYYYHAPLGIMFNFEYTELPLLLNKTSLLPIPLPAPDAEMTYYEQRQQEQTVIDLTPIKELNLTLCFGKEWHRFPGHFFVPNGIRVEFIKSDVAGLLPGHFGEGGNRRAEETNLMKLSSWWPRPETRYVPKGYNDLNLEELSHYVPVSQCDYMVDLDFPDNPSVSALEPRYAVDVKTWERIDCLPFLDAHHSPLLSRALWFPGQTWSSINSWGDYCLLKNTKLVDGKVKALKYQV